MSKIILALGLVVSASSYSSLAFAYGPLCERSLPTPGNREAIETVAFALQYKPYELCAHPGVSAIEIQHTTLLDQNQRKIPHTWLTIHYGEYSCQYFVRDATQTITKKNCYPTW